MTQQRLNNIMCSYCDCNKFIILSHDSGMEVLCSQCNDRVFYLNIPYAAMKHPEIIGRKILQRHIEK